MNENVSSFCVLPVSCNKKLSGLCVLSVFVNNGEIREKGLIITINNMGKVNKNDSTKKTRR